MADGDVHVVPIGDLIDHEETEDCICGPDVEIHPECWLVIHHSLDGRERHES